MLNVMAIDILIVKDGLVHKNANSTGHQLKSRITREEIRRRIVLQDEHACSSKRSVLPNSRLHLASIGIEVPHARLIPGTIIPE